MNIIWVIWSLLGSLLHLGDEITADGGPIWDNFGKIIGVKLPAWLGFMLFTVTIGAALATLAIIGYGYGNQMCVSLLVGTKIGDILFSHLFPTVFRANNPNPGLHTTPLYCFEAIMASICLELDIGWALIGIWCFALVLPILWLIGRLVPPFRIRGNNVDASY